MREALAYRAGWRPDPLALEATEFLFRIAPWAGKTGPASLCERLLQAGAFSAEAAEALMGKIHAEFKFDAEATTTTTPVDDILQAKTRRVPGLHPLYDLLLAFHRPCRSLRERLSRDAVSAGQTTARGCESLPRLGGTVRARQRVDRSSIQPTTCYLHGGILRLGGAAIFPMSRRCAVLSTAAGSRPLRSR